MQEITTESEQKSNHPTPIGHTKFKRKKKRKEKKTKMECYKSKTHPILIVAIVSNNEYKNCALIIFTSRRNQPQPFI